MFRFFWSIKWIFFYNFCRTFGPALQHFLSDIHKKCPIVWQVRRISTPLVVNWLRNRHRLRVAPVFLLAKYGAESTGSDVYWRETELAGKNWRKGDLFMLDDTAMDFIQGQNVKLLIDVLGNIKVWVNNTLHFKNLIHWYIIEKKSILSMIFFYWIFQQY